jgi:hypothetical protein
MVHILAALARLFKTEADLRPGYIERRVGGGWRLRSEPRPKQRRRP